MNDATSKNWWDGYDPQSPTGSGVVFGPRKDSHLNACVSYLDSETQWGFYADGYRLAGDLLVDHVSSTNAEQDILVYPIAFNYRQYLEVKLKGMLILANAAGHPMDASTKHKLTRSHNLADFWPKVRSVLAQVGSTGAELDGVGHVIRQFNGVDATSFAFRYPVQTDARKPSLPAGLSHVNLGLLRDSVSMVARVLDAMSEALSQYADQKREHEAESCLDGAA